MLKRLCVPLVLVLAGGLWAGAAPISRNLQADYGADPANGDVTAMLQRALDDVAANPDGGTVVIPAHAQAWQVSRPLFVGSPKVTIAGEGMGTTIRMNGRCSLFLLGIRDAYPEAPISAAHFPSVAGQTPPVLDTSVPRATGLRTNDGHVRAAGFFPLCPFTLGARLARYPNNGTHYSADPVFTVELCVRNNGDGVMKGVICGVGDGPRGDIGDPMTLWTIDSDPTTGAHLAFHARVQDAMGRESLLTLPLATAPVGAGTLRVAVQLDFTAGRACAWSSISTVLPLPLACTAVATLPTGTRFKTFAYGAFRLGRVTDSPFTGSPADPLTRQLGDWTYAGVYLGDALRYAWPTAPGAAQARLDGAAITDASRYFTRDAGSIALSSDRPRDPAASNHLVLMRCGQRTDGEYFYGYWLPMRPLALNAQGGTTIVRNLRLDLCAPFTGAAIVIGEASRVSISEVVSCMMNAHGISDWGCHVPNCPVTVTHVAFDALEAIYYGKSQNLDIRQFNGRPGWTAFRLVGCQGALRGMLLGDSDNTDHAYFMLHAGPYGGPLSIENICFDNEGYENPHLDGALFYAEPSLHPGPGGNALDIKLIYDGTMYTRLNQAVVQLADAPGGAVTPPGRLTLALLAIPNAPEQHPACLVRCSSTHWEGRIEGYPQHDMRLTIGPIDYSGPPGGCRLHTYQYDAIGLPTEGAWLAGCHELTIPAALPAPGSGTVYRCTKSGVYGTPTPPVWTPVGKEAK